MKNPPTRAGLSVVQMDDLANPFHLNRPRLSSGNTVSANGSACADFTPFPRRVVLQPEGEAMPMQSLDDFLSERLAARLDALADSPALLPPANPIRSTRKA